MTIKYGYCTQAIITFDDLFNLEISDSLDKIVEVASYYIQEYGFYKALVTDKNTGEILVSISNT